MRKGKKWITNKWPMVIFPLVYLLVALYFSLPQGFGPSMDGPSHFYNSLLLKEYFLGNDTLHANFSLTPIYTPNLFSTYYIAGLLALFSFKTCVFIFFFTYFLLALFSLNYLLKSYNIRYSHFLSLAAVIFFDSSLLNTGFYNFSWSIIFLFFAIGFARHYFTRGILTAKNGVIFFILLLVLYYSNALTFIFYLLYVAAAEFQLAYFSRKRFKETYKKRYSFLFKSALILSPFVILLVCFYIKTPLYKSQVANDIAYYHDILLDMSSLVSYASEEKVYTHELLYGLLALFGVVIMYRAVKKEFRRDGDFFFLLALAMLFSFYKVPDNSGVGMMSVRFQHFFYLFLVVWLLLQRYYLPGVVFVAFSFFVSIQKFNNIHKKGLLALNTSAAEIIKGGEYIERDKSVAAFNYTGNWLMPHFSNYLGISKPLIITDNYEAGVGWFPLKWNYEKAPIYMFADKPLVSSANEIKRTKQPVDYVVVFGNLFAFKEDTMAFKFINEKYKMIYESNPAYMVVYSLR